MMEDIKIARMHLADALDLMGSAFFGANRFEVLKAVDSVNLAIIKIDEYIEKQFQEEAHKDGSKTREDIMKALRQCSSNSEGCEGCPYYDHDPDCISILCKDALEEMDKA